MVMMTPPGTDERGTPRGADLLAALAAEPPSDDGYVYVALGPSAIAELAAIAVAGCDGDPDSLARREGAALLGALPDTRSGDVRQAVEDARHAINYAASVLEIVETGGVLTETFMRRFREARDIALAALSAARAAGLRGALPDSPAMALENVAREAVAAFGGLVDNADGYDKSNFRNAVSQVEHLGGSLGAWTKQDLLAMEERARNAWKSLRAALSGTPEPREPFTEAADAWERLGLPPFAVDGHLDGRYRTFTVPEVLRIAGERASSLSGTPEQPSLGPDVRLTPAAVECQRWDCDGDHPWFYHDPDDGRLRECEDGAQAAADPETLDNTAPPAQPECEHGLDPDACSSCHPYPEAPADGADPLTEWLR